MSISPFVALETPLLADHTNAPAILIYSTARANAGKLCPWEVILGECPQRICFFKHNKRESTPVSAFSKYLPGTSPPEFSGQFRSSGDRPDSNSDADVELMTFDEG